MKHFLPIRLIDAEAQAYHAEMAAKASLYRTKSRWGLYHYRLDFPNRNDEEWMYHTLSSLNENNTVVHEKCDVNMNGLYPDEMEIVPPAKRVY